ncbi:pseudouridine synthase [Patescibacteria group bacterium]
MRLQRYIALNSSYSRRKAEVLIEEGRVSVNGEIVTKLGTQVDPETNPKVTVDDETIKPKAETITLMLNKPSGYITTRSDTENRKTVMDLIPYDDLFPVGRLDRDTEGLLLLTNDGDLAYKITHPKFEHEKEYMVYSKKELTQAQKEALEKGVMIDKKMTSPCEVDIKDRKTKNNHGVCHVTIHEGRKRQIKRMFEEIGNPVIYLMRVRIGKLRLGSLEKGKFRILNNNEIDKLLA